MPRPIPAPAPVTRTEWSLKSNMQLRSVLLWSRKVVGAQKHEGVTVCTGLGTSATAEHKTMRVFHLFDEDRDRRVGVDTESIGQRSPEATPGFDRIEDRHVVGTGDAFE